MANLDQVMNDSLQVEENHPTNEASPGPSKDSAGSRKLIESDGEIGYRKNGVFYPMTNFSLACVGYVVDHIGSTKANGFLFNVMPKDSVETDDLEDAASDTTQVLLVISCGKTYAYIRIFQFSFIKRTKFSLQCSDT